LPTFGDVTGSATTSALSSGSGSQVTIKVSNQNFDSVANVSSNQAGTPILYTSLAVSQSVTFATPSIATVVTSQCLILPNHTYNVGLYVFGSPAGSQYGATNVVPNGHTISFSIGVPLGGTFPSGATGDVVISQN
jgi:hypothetical protein